MKDSSGRAGIVDPRRNRSIQKRRGRRGDRGPEDRRTIDSGQVTVPSRDPTRFGQDTREELAKKPSTHVDHDLANMYGFDDGPRDTGLLPLPLAGFALSSLPLLLRTRLASSSFPRETRISFVAAAPRTAVHVGVLRGLDQRL